MIRNGDVKKHTVYREITGMYCYVMQFGFDTETDERVVIYGNLADSSDIRADSCAEFKEKVCEVQHVPESMLSSLREFQKSYEND